MSIIVPCKVVHQTEKAYLAVIEDEKIWVAKSKSHITKNGLKVQDWIVQDWIKKERLSNDKINKIMENNNKQFHTETIQDEYSPKSIGTECPYCGSMVTGAKCNYCGVFINPKSGSDDTTKLFESIKIIEEPINIPSQPMNLTIEKKNLSFSENFLSIMKIIGTVIFSFGLFVIFL